MEYVLVIILVLGNDTTTSTNVTFKSEKTCVDAARALHSRFVDIPVKIITCFRR